ncbi:MAG TPA: FixH family protein [Polyangiaceae bacterium]|nr:FixH family protein [Polyangiaceae bacterium]
MQLVAACGSAADDDTTKGDELPPADCEGRSEDFSPGASAMTRDGELRFQLVSATPAVPSNTDNFWTVALTDSAEVPIDDATIVAVPYMVDHGHGTAPQLATSLGEGQYELGPVTLTMPGFWEITLEVTLADGAKTSAIYPICVQAE